MSKTTTQAPTRMQARILAFVARELRRHGAAPTRKEIGEHLGIAAPTVQEHIERMKRKRLLVVRPRQHRGLVLRWPAP